AQNYEGAHPAGCLSKRRTRVRKARRLPRLQLAHSGVVRRVVHESVCGLNGLPERSAGKKFSGGALAAGDGAVQRPIVSAAIRRFSGKEQSIPNRCTQSAPSFLTTGKRVTVGTSAVGIGLPVMYKRLLQQVSQAFQRYSEDVAQDLQPTLHDGCISATGELLSTGSTGPTRQHGGLRRYRRPPRRKQFPWS